MVMVDVKVITKKGSKDKSSIDGGKVGDMTHNEAMRLCNIMEGRGNKNSSPKSSSRGGAHYHNCN